MTDLLQFLNETARRAGALALGHQRRPADLMVESKAPMDFVTAADRAAENEIVAMIGKDFPDDAMLGEEGGPQGSSRSGRLWVIDPIDGTANYMRSLPWWSVSIGLLDNGRPIAGIIHAPAMGVTLATIKDHGVWLNGEMFALDPADTGPQAPIVLTGASPTLAAEGLTEELSVMIRTQLRGIERRLGCGTASILQVLLGKADLYFGLGERIWDVCAAAIIAEELGLKHSIQWSDDRASRPFNFACGAEALLIEVLDRLRPNAALAFGTP